MLSFEQLFSVIPTTKPKQKIVIFFLLLSSSSSFQGLSVYNTNQLFRISRQTNMLVFVTFRFGCVCVFFSITSFLSHWCKKYQLSFGVHLSLFIIRKKAQFYWIKSGQNVSGICVFFLMIWKKVRNLPITDSSSIVRRFDGTTQNHNIFRIDHLSTAANNIQLLRFFILYLCRSHSFKFELCVTFKTKTTTNT